MHCLGAVFSPVSVDPTRHRIYLLNGVLTRSEINPDPENGVWKRHHRHYCPAKNREIAADGVVVHCFDGLKTWRLHPVRRAAVDTYVQVDGNCDVGFNFELLSK